MAAPIEIRFTEDQQEGTEATVTRWLVAEGDRVAAHDPVVEIETDKVVVEVAAPETGTIESIRVQTDEAVNPGDVLCLLAPGEGVSGAREAAPASEAQSSDAAPAGKAGDDRLSPAVRQRVQQHGLDIRSIRGSGRDGRITLADIEGLIAEATSPGRPEPAPAPPEVSGEDVEIIPHDTMRRRIAENMVTSLLHTAPHVTAVFEADLSAVISHRQANRAALEARGIPLTLTAYFVAATVAAMRAVPRVNSRWHDDHLEVFRHVNIGIGTALGDQGLIVPVLHNAQALSLEEIATALADLTGRARDNRLKPAEVRGGTFTISNHGVSGSLVATPIIINQPQSAILGVGKIEKRTRVVQVDGADAIVIRPMCYVSLTIDHRVLDAHQTNAFLATLVDTLENWSQ